MQDILILTEEGISRATGGGLGYGRLEADPVMASSIPVVLERRTRGHCPITQQRYHASRSLCCK
jgi:hypothetical protein